MFITYQFNIQEEDFILQQKKNIKEFGYIKMETFYVEMEKVEWVEKQQMMKTV